MPLVDGADDESSEGGEGDSGARAAAPTGQPPTPRQALAERFARGEIDEEEYTRRLQVLGRTGSASRPGG